MLGYRLFLGDLLELLLEGLFLLLNFFKFVGQELCLILSKAAPLVFLFFGQSLVKHQVFRLDRLHLGEKLLGLFGEILTNKVEQCLIGLPYKTEWLRNRRVHRVYHGLEVLADHLEEVFLVDLLILVFEDSLEHHGQLILSFF